MPKLTASFDYTDAELLALWRECYATISVEGQEFEYHGKTFTFADLRYVQQQIEWLENRISAAGSGITRTPIERRRPNSGISSC